MAYSKSIEKEVLLMALKTTSEALDRLVEACLLDGKPTAGEIMKARAYLPPYCKHAFRKN